MDAMQSLQEFFNTILIPAIFAGGATIVAIITKYSKRYLKSIEVKHELENLAKTNEIKNSILKEIETTVSAIVGSNMQAADSKKKENGGYLTEDQSVEINNKVKKLVNASLPASLTEDDGVLLEVMGGKDRLQIIVDNMIERCIYDYKLKKNGSSK